MAVNTVITLVVMLFCIILVGIAFAWHRNCEKGSFLSGLSLMLCLGCAAGLFVVVVRYFGGM